MRFYLTGFLIGVSLAYSQPYDKGLMANRYKFTVVYPDYTVTAVTAPINGLIRPRPDKKYYWYASNRIQMTQGGFSGKLLHGPYTAFYVNKNLKEQGLFSSGLKSGEWRIWSEAGVLKEHSKWKEGEKNGPYFIYNDSGKLLESGRYRKGLLNGQRIQYSGKDSTKITFYKNGKPVSRKNTFMGWYNRMFKKGKASQ